MAQVYGLKICHIQYMEELCTNINLRSGLYGSGLWTQNSSYPVYGKCLYLNKCHTWVIWHRSVHSNLVIHRTVKCYNMLFKSFVAFCLCARVDLANVCVSVALSYLEFLVENNVSVNMVKNHISAIRAMSIIFDLQYGSWEHPRVKYFVKALKLHRPMVLPKRNIIDISTLKRMVALCNRFSNPEVYKAVMLTAFFGFFRLSNIAPHGIADFDCDRHFTGGDIFFQKNEVKLLIKWSKTMQYRDEYKLITLPKLGASCICP